jgi:isocitrate/methylisocitrate lyase
VRLRGSFDIEHTIARRGAERLWDLLRGENYVHALGAMTGGQAVEMVKAGLEVIYLSGWQVAADANLSGETYPDQSLYPANSAPAVVRRLNVSGGRASTLALEGSTETAQFGRAGEPHDTPSGSDVSYSRLTGGARRDDSTASRSWCSSRRASRTSSSG